MPELPEVETIRRTLVQHVRDLQIKEILLYWPAAACGWDGRDFAALITGRRILDVERRGKYLLILLDEDLTMIAHMRMTGRLSYYPDRWEADKHTHVVFRLDRGELHFSDVRKFGRLQVVSTPLRFEEPALSKLGPEPLDVDFTPAVLQTRFEKKKGTLKGVLLDQTVLAGLGNIYADESLFLAGLSPERRADSLCEAEIAKLHQAIQKVLQAGIAAQGTSFRDYRDANGNKGSFQEALQVYGRGGKPCPACGHALTRIRLAGRSTVYCENCQK